MEKNKTGKYFKYAIGEIILVVIGILIALQINNWNIESVERNEEHTILNEILINLNTDLETINNTIEFNKGLSKHNQLVYEHLKNKTPITDSLKYHYARLYGYGDFQPITVAFENLKSRGVNIIKNESLRKQISELYMLEFKNLSDRLNQNLQPIQSMLLSQINGRLITEKSYVSAQPVDLTSLQNDIQFQETLKLTTYVWNGVNSMLNKGKEDIMQTKTAIEEELSNK